MLLFMLMASGSGELAPHHPCTNCYGALTPQQAHTNTPPQRVVVVVSCRMVSICEHDYNKLWRDNAHFLTLLYKSEAANREKDLEIQDLRAQLEMEKENKASTKGLEDQIRKLNLSIANHRTNYTTMRERLEKQIEDQKNKNTEMEEQLGSAVGRLQQENTGLHEQIAQLRKRIEELEKENIEIHQSVARNAPPYSLFGPSLFAK